MRDKLLQAVTQMRYWQKEYFRHKAGFALDEAKRYEAMVDKLLAERNDPQKTLFDTEDVR